MHVLVVEDDETTATILERVLRAQDSWEVTRAATMQEAEAILLEGPERVRGDAEGPVDAEGAAGSPDPRSGEEGPVDAEGAAGSPDPRSGEGGPVDVVVLDHLLPDGTGLELLQRVSRADALLPVVFLTGEGDEQVAYRALSQGAVDYLVKGEDPVPEELPDRLERAVERWEALGPLEVVEDQREDEEESEGAGSKGKGGAKSGSRGRKRRRPPVQQDYDDLDDLLDAVEAEDSTGTAVYDGQGKLLSASLPEGTNRKGIGTLAVDVSRHVSALALAAGRTPRRHFLVVETREGVVASSIVPGPLIFVMLFPGDVAHEEALHRLKRTARKVWGAGGGSSGPSGGGEGVSGGS